jgi:hypothetical protein
MSISHLDVRQFTGRLPQGAPAHYRENIEVVFGLAANFLQKAREVQDDPALTDVGRGEALRKLWAGNGHYKPALHLGQIKQSIAKEFGAIDAQRSALYPKPPDRADLFGEMQRAEVRKWLRGLPDADRMRAVLETKDTLLRDAVIHAPAELSGIRADFKQTVIEKIVQEKHGSQLAKLNSLADGLENVQAAITVAEMQIAKLPGLASLRDAA